ncbi:MAG TPA: hypothetical protein VGL66_17975 [Caulobacteraceae bacterium]|jgi:hypothetical protein
MSVRIRQLIAPAILGPALLGMAALALSGAAAAFPDARIEAQLRPDFGLLLKPHLHRHHHHWGVGGCVDCGGGYGPGYGPGGPVYVPDYGPGRGPIGPMLDAASVDCNDPAQGAHLAELVRRLNPGGTLIMKPGAACVGTLYIDKPITIEGQGDRPYGRNIPIGPDDSAVVERGVATIIGPPDGRAPCMVVRIQDDLATDSQRAVVLRNIALQSGHDSDESCLDIEHGVVKLETAMIDYAGHGQAIYVGDGMLMTGDPRGQEDPHYDAGGRRDRVFIQAPSAEAALEVDGGQIELRDTTIVGSGINFDSADKGSTIDAIAVIQPPSSEAGRAFDPGQAGISIGGHGRANLNIRDSTICGFGIGVFMESANVVNMDNNLICRAAKGIYAAGGQFSADNNQIAVSNIGIQIGAASPISVTGNGIYGTATGREGEGRHHRGGDEYFVYIEPGGAETGISGNLFYSSYGMCAWRDLDDGYFGGHRRPWRGEGWRHYRYMPGAHLSGFGACADPSQFNPGEESEWFDPATSVGFYGNQLPWPAELDRIGEPYDKYDWDHPWHPTHDGCADCEGGPHWFRR